MSLKIFVTGANGFVGNAMCLAALKSKMLVYAVTRKPIKFPAGIVNFNIENLDREKFKNIFPDGCNVVVHTAAVASVSKNVSKEELENVRNVNLDGALRLAQAAASAGVERFIFLSSIKVNGESTLPCQAFSEQSINNPIDAYGIYKLEAERALLAFGSKTSMEIVIIRPALVYGPGVKGNFANMINLVKRGLPMPFGSVHNQRSMVALENLVSLLLLCADRERSPHAANQVFVVSDGEDVSTSTLLRKVARAVGRPSRLLPVPASWLSVGAFLLGKREIADRLLGNLQVDASKARTLLGWRPVITMDEQLEKMFEHKD